MFAGFIYMILMFTARAVQAQEIVTALSESVISITTSFRGTQLSVFGAIPSRARGRANPEPDVVVIIRGPAKSVMVRRKERVAGIWVNRHGVRFDGVPSFYALAGTRALEEIAPEHVLVAHGIGYKALAFQPGPSERGAGASRAPEIAEYRLAVLRRREAQGLFRQKEQALDLFGQVLFRAKFDLPATVAPGIYQAEVYLFQNGRLISHQISPLYIDQYGVERFLHSIAHRRPLLYGLMAVILALSAGLGIASLFRNPIGH